MKESTIDFSSTPSEQEADVLLEELKQLQAYDPENLYRGVSIDDVAAIREEGTNLGWNYFHASTEQELGERITRPPISALDYPKGGAHAVVVYDKTQLHSEGIQHRWGFNNPDKKRKAVVALVHIERE